MGLMTYGPDDVSSDLAQISSDAASFEVRARLEFYLLDLLKNQGCEAVASLLQSLPGHNFSLAGDCVSVPEARFVSAGPGTLNLVVTTFLGPHSASVNVTAEDGATAPIEPDTHQQAFYTVWESLLGIEDSAVARLDAKRKAVFLIGLLEAEVMNGGLGQYLTNTDGAYFNDTLDCLARIGAVVTRDILNEAGNLGAAAESYVSAWESNSRDFERLDERFLNTGEDLAGLTARAFI